MTTWTLQDLDINTTNQQERHYPMKKLTLSDLILTIRSLFEKLLGPSKSPTELSRRTVSKPIRRPIGKQLKYRYFPAVKKSNGKIVKAKSKKESHDDLNTEGKRGFILSDGKFAGREEAATVAKKAKQVPKTVKKFTPKICGRKRNEI